MVAGDAAASGSIRPNVAASILSISERSDSLAALTASDSILRLMCSSPVSHCRSLRSYSDSEWRSSARILQDRSFKGQRIAFELFGQLLDAFCAGEHRVLGVALD